MVDWLILSKPVIRAIRIACAPQLQNPRYCLSNSPHPLFARTTLIAMRPKLLAFSFTTEPQSTFQAHQQGGQKGNETQAM
jgi:hypothetical protein